MKRVLTYVTVLAVLLTLFSVRAGAMGETYTYREENGKAVITGICDIADGNLLFPSAIDGLEVTAIDDWAFSGIAGLYSVYIPGSIAKIGDGAFSGCKGLNSVTLENGVSLVGWDAFSDCVSLTDITLPGSVKTVGGFAFSGCRSLAAITLSHGTARINNFAFENCTSLVSVFLPDSVEEIGLSAFDSCDKLSDIYYGSDKTGKKNMAILESNRAVFGAAWHYNYSSGGVLAGDINGDGSLNNKDLTRLFQYLSDWNVYAVGDALDVNGDGAVNNKDLTRLFQFLSDWDVAAY